MARPIFVAEDDKVAAAYGKTDANSPYRFYLQQLSSKLRKIKRLNAFKQNVEMPDEDVTLDYMVDTLVAPVRKVVRCCASMMQSSSPVSIL
ncbi:MAG: hypothetical protein QOF09_4191 [Alphaproteobacteria bacterium]|nr:hypothetical protein [Alphaproteobacteria bacterium]